MHHVPCRLLQVLLILAELQKLGQVVKNLIWMHRQSLHFESHMEVKNNSQKTGYCGGRYRIITDYYSKLPITLDDFLVIMDDHWLSAIVQ